MKKLNLDLPLDRVSPNGIRKLRCKDAVFKLIGELTHLLIERKFINEPADLEDLHLYVRREFQLMDEDATNAVSRSFYETSSSFEETYLDLMRRLVLELRFDFIFQATPTIRFHFPVPMPDKFRCKDGSVLCCHTDTMLGHPFEEINFWVPFTRCYGTNGLLLCSVQDGISTLTRFCKDLNLDADEYHRNGRNLFLQKLNSDSDFSNYVKERCQPMAFEVGEFIGFDSRCIHGPDENRERHTRVSMDFRIIPIHLYEQMSHGYRSGGRSHRRFIRGDVFFSKSASEL